MPTNREIGDVSITNTHYLEKMKLKRILNTILTCSTGDLLSVVEAIAQGEGIDLYGKVKEQPKNQLSFIE